MIPERERYQAPFTHPVAVERFIDPAGVLIKVNPVNPFGISRVTGMFVRATFPVFVRVIVYSNTSPMIPSPPFMSETVILSSRRGILRINAVVLFASI